MFIGSIALITVANLVAMLFVLHLSVCVWHEDLFLRPDPGMTNAAAQPGSRAK
jgi:hypothetical protein